MRVSFTQLAATMISGLLTSSTSTSPRCSARGKWAWKLEGLFNIQAILPSSEISSEIDKNRQLIWPEIEKCRW
jgi:hypothetical protein